MVDKLKKEGEKYKDFALIRSIWIEEIQAQLKELIHLPTGAQVMHIENDDPENVFCLSFKTWPNDDCGAPHILEHVTLCGSKRFPVKDPFFAMSRRSLNTYMNALTGADFTCYPAATQVEKDFYNLLDIYIDAVFHPLLRETSFMQEGHRLEFARGDDPKSALEIKGIVYNEMKGSMSSPDVFLWHHMMTHLAPDLPYAYNSGGDPKAIPELTYRQLIEFHETHYHPSRCLFYFYGNFPLEKHLDFIEEKALKNVPKLPPLPPIAHQKRFSEPKSFHMTYPLSEKKDLENKYIHAFGWLTTAMTNQEEVNALSILDSVLMDTDASPLKKALHESGLCLSADAFIDLEMTEVSNILICKGCKKEDLPALERVIRSTLEKLAVEGIAYHLIESAIHQLEFSRLEISGDHSPFGLTLFMRSALAKQHGCDPAQALTVHEHFEEILQKAKNPRYFTPLIEKYFLKNTHLVRATLEPDPDFDEKNEQEEKQQLAAKKAKLTDKETLHILQTWEKLENYHEEEQNLNCLPKVTLDDVPKTSRDYPLDKEKRGAFTLFHTDTFTNHICYADLIFDLPELEEEEHFLLQMLMLLWPELGAGGRSFEENLEFMHAHTGGISAHASLHVQVSDSEKMRPSLQFRGKAMKRKLPQFFTLLQEMITQPRFDEEKRIGEQIKKYAHSMQSRMARNAMGFASKTALSGLGAPAYINNLWYGLPFYQRLQALAKNPKNFGEKLRSLAEKIFCRGHPELILSCDADMVNELDKHAFYGLLDLPLKKAGSLWKPAEAPSDVESQIRCISSPVAFTSKAYKTASYKNTDAPTLAVVTELMENKVLHHRIREQGGAYGSGASYNPLLGHFYFYSYRDPHLAHTLRAFDAAIEEIGALNFDAQDLEEAKLGVIQHIDQPVSPGSQGMVAFFWERDGKTLQHRQNFRDRLLKTTKEDIASAIQKNLIGKKGTVCSFTGKAMAKKENALLDSPLPVKEVSDL